VGRPVNLHQSLASFIQSITLTIDAVVMADDATVVYIVKQELADP
jgi:hypothetical protein